MFWITLIQYVKTYNIEMSRTTYNKLVYIFVLSYNTTLFYNTRWVFKKTTNLAGLQRKQVVPSY